MNVEILASGSKANCYTVCDGKATILIECGLSAQKTLQRLHGKLPDAILITHEHHDHAYSARNFLERGVEMYMTAGTAKQLKLNRHNLHIIKPYENFSVCGHEILAIPTIHDAAEPVCFVLDGEILFVTDTGQAPNVKGRFSKVFVEANYDFTRLLKADISDGQRLRILENHMSIRQTRKFLSTLAEPDEVWLIHLSTRHGNAADFVEQVKAATGFKKVFAAEVTK